MNLAALGFLLSTLGGGNAALLPSPVPCIPAPVVACPSPSPSPVPSPSPRPSPSPSPSPSPAASPTPTNSGGGGISTAFVPQPTPAGDPGASPTPLYVPPPVQSQGQGLPSFLQMFPPSSGNAVPDPERLLLVGLLLVTVGVGLMAIRHRREALSAAAMERTKTDFLNLASHELRGPLTVLKGYLSIAHDGGMGKLPNRFANALPTLEAKVNEMEVLVDQMVEAARLEAGSPELKLTDGDLRDVVREAVPFHLWDAPATDFRLELPAQPVMVRLDDYRLRTLISHLFDNAIKYSPEGVHVTAVLSVEAAQASLTIADQGIGIAAEDMGRLFTRFGRIRNERSAGVHGLGLGLYLSKQVARLHGGDLVATSRAGEGSTFTLTLPLIGAEPEKGITRRLSSSAG